MTTMGNHTQSKVINSSHGIQNELFCVFLGDRFESLRSFAGFQTDSSM